MPDPSHQPSASAAQPDLQETPPRVLLPLARAGVIGVRAHARVADGTPTGQICLVDVDASTSLAASQRGVHMSRFHEALAHALDHAAQAARNPAALAADIARIATDAQMAPGGEARVCGALLLPDRTPATGRDTTFPVRFEARAAADAGSGSGSGTVRTTLTVTVAGINACPCAQALVRAHAREELLARGICEAEVDVILDCVPGATHNQRGEASLTVGAGTMPDLAHLASLARESMSAHVHELLKRSDELHVVRQAHEHPRFVEDCVRELLGRALLDLPLADDDLVWAVQVNHESIHAHDVRAEAGGSVRELRAALAGQAPARPLTPDVWLLG
jgi:MptA/FolE2 family GTP cyclohydrolase